MERAGRAARAEYFPPLPGTVYCKLQNNDCMSAAWQRLSPEDENARACGPASVGPRKIQNKANVVQVQQTIPDTVFQARSAASTRAEISEEAVGVERRVRQPPHLGNVSC
jgi:hypothetical protein